MLATCCSGLFIVGLDATIANLALPSIRRDLGSSLSGLQWVIDAYTLVLASLLVLGGSTVFGLGSGPRPGEHHTPGPGDGPPNGSRSAFPRRPTGAAAR